MSSFDLELELADFRRSYEQVYLSLAEAATLPEEASRGERAVAFERAMVARDMLIDRAAVLDIVMALTCVLAAKMNSTPRRIHDELFELAPSDEWWKERLER